MITDITAYVHTIEHDLRVDQVNRRGWLLTSLTETRKPSGPGAFFSHLISFVFHGKLGHANDMVSAGDASATAMSHVRGTA